MCFRSGHIDDAELISVHCAPAVHVETNNTADLGRYKTYQWVETSAAQHNGKSITAFGEQTIHGVASREVQKKGLREVDGNPDLFITHDVLVKFKN